MNDMELILEVFTNCKDPAVQKQLAFILGRQVIPLTKHGYPYFLTHISCSYWLPTSCADLFFQQLFLELDEEQFPDAEELMEIMSNVHLNTNFQSLARELDIMEPKVGIMHPTCGYTCFS